MLLLSPQTEGEYWLKYADIIYLPTRYSSLTLVSASMPGSTATDLTTWATKTNMTTPDATTVTDSSDGAPTQHFIANAMTSVQTNRPITLTCTVSAGTLSQIFVQPGGANERVAWDLSSQTVISAGSNVTARSLTSLGGGQYQASVTATTTSSTLNVGLFKSGSITYLGDGTGTAHFTNFVVTQQNVSGWTNLGAAGSGWNVSQATASKCPYFNPTGGFNGGPAINGVAASSTLLSQTSTTQAQPITMVCRARMSMGATRVMLDGSAVTTRQIGQLTGGARLHCGAALSAGGGTSEDGLWHIYGGVANGTSSIIFRDSTSASGNAGTGTGSQGMTIFASGTANGNYADGPIDAIYGWFQALSSNNLKAIRLALGGSG